MLFCEGIGMHVILRRYWNACYFAKVLECMLFCEGIFVPNLFCEGIFVPNLFCEGIFVPNLFCEGTIEIDNDPFFGNAPDDQFNQRSISAQF